MNITFQNKSSTDLSGKQGYVAKFDTDGINVASAITDQALGIIETAGETECDVCVHGECYAIAGGTITKGKAVIPHTDGTVKNTASSSQEFGIALESGVAGDRVRIFVVGAVKTQS